MDSLTIVAASSAKATSTLSEITGLISSVSSLLSSIAWPTAAVIIFSIFRKQILKLIPRVKKVTAGNNGIEFADQAQIGEAILELGERVVPEQKKIEQAKEALVKENNLTENDKEKLTKEIIKSSQKVAQLEEEKQRLREIILDWEKIKSQTSRPTKKSLSPEFIIPKMVFNQLFEPAIANSESERKKNTILAIVKEIGAETAAKLEPDELRAAFKSVCQRIRDGGPPQNVGVNALIELNNSGLINIYDTLTPSGVSVVKSYARDLVQVRKNKT